VPEDNELHDLREPGNPKVRLVAFVVILGVLVWFGVGNRQLVQVSFLFFHGKVRLIYALAVAAVLGALADRLATLIHRRGR
jgi:hypothetical protein